MVLFIDTVIHRENLLMWEDLLSVYMMHRLFENTRR